MSEDLEAFRRRAREWLASQCERRDASRVATVESDLGVFRNLSDADERAYIGRAREWRRRKVDAGFAALAWEPEYGGQGLPPAYDRVVSEEEAAFETPPLHEAVAITTDLIAPTVRAWGSDGQRSRFLRPMIRTDEMWCQLFSEPGAGSDLASVSTSATRDGDSWVVNGQKVWTSGAQVADWGYALCRTAARDVPDHRALTAFLLPMDAPGVEVRPLRQMSGGASFNEVFFDDARLDDAMRLGPEGDGWKVAITTLGFERSSGTGDPGLLEQRFERARALADRLGQADDPIRRQLLARALIGGRLARVTDERVKATLRAGETPGPEGSIGKLFAANRFTELTELMSAILGPSLVADDGRPGTFRWSDHVTTSPGFRIAGGTDEIQRNIIGERVLGLPREPRPDR